eukprot:1532654-Rhodomonas_salina.1
MAVAVQIDSAKWQQVAPALSPIRIFGVGDRLQTPSLNLTMPGLGSVQALEIGAEITLAGQGRSLFPEAQRRFKQPFEAG